MRLFLLGSLLAIAAIIVAGDNLFDDSLWAASGSQDIGQNQDFSSNLISEDPNASPDYSLFSDFDLAGSTSTINLDDSLNLLASCHVDDEAYQVEGGGEQPLSKLRARDEQDSCSSGMNPVPLQGDLRKLGEGFQRLLNGETIFDLLGTPLEPGPERPPPPLPPFNPSNSPDDNPCVPPYGSHLCCITVDPDYLVIEGRVIYDDARTCSPGTLIVGYSTLPLARLGPGGS